MFNQRGNFLLQALLAISLLFVFMPVLTRRLIVNDVDAKMYSSVHQIDTAQTAARIFIRENVDALSYGKTTIRGNDFGDVLEPYGLPLGYIPQTAFGQDIYLIVDKNETGVSGRLMIDGGKLTTVQVAEMVRRIGFYAERTTTGLMVGIPLNTLYQEVVRRNESNLTNSAFLADLDMNNFSVENVNHVIGHNIVSERATFDTLGISGNEGERGSKNKIKILTADKSIFQSKSGGSALALTRGALKAKNVFSKTISEYGSTGNFESDTASVYSFDMTAGRTGFTGPTTWDVRGNMETEYIALTTERLEVGSYLNVSSGQDAYVNDTTITTSASSGISAVNVVASHITLRDQTSKALDAGDTGAVIVDIRPASTTVLPDVRVAGVNNNDFAILKYPKRDSDETLTCQSVITSMGENYNASSVAQHILCEYLFWSRLEQRINAKQCLMAGGSDCI
ncbi:MAG: hypothetical protein MJ164_00835 [Alphaproteobacteria bacterium]|nr:hypothetical protein [Alphaproteobacteria bacterium]